MPFLQTIGGGSVQGYKPQTGNQIIDATGGTTEEYTDSWGDKWKSHTFTSNGSFVVNSAPAVDTSKKKNNAYQQIQILIVGGGGGGGGGHDADWFGGGGGGAGGVVIKDKYTPVASTYSISIGNGGSGGAAASNGSGPGGSQQGSGGGDSSAFGYTAKGGGGGASSGTGDLGGNGGSGGGDGSSSTYYPGGQTNQTTYNGDPVVYGSDGGHGYSDGGHPYGGGGGGAMGCGAPPMNENNQSKHVAGMGGKPIALKFQNNTMKTYAAGGGGGGAGHGDGSSSGGSGGLGYGHGDHQGKTTNAGGYNRGNLNTTGINGGNATNGFGHGGGGGAGGPAGTTGPSGNGGSGGKGVVIVRYLIEENPNGAWRSDNNYYDGSSSAKAAECAGDILTHNGAAGNGWYWIKPKWYPKDPFKVYCNMTCDGGGWMRYGVAANTSGVGNRVLVPFQCFYGGTNYYGPADTRSYNQESFSRFDIAKYHANHCPSGTNTQMMWRRIDNDNPILIHSIETKFNSVLGASEFGNNEEYTNNGETQATGGGNNATKGGYSPFKEDGSSLPSNWPQFNNGWRTSGGDGLKINLMRMSNSGEGGIVTKNSGGGASSPTERYETGPGYPGIAWNSSYGNNQDNVGGFNNYINRRGLVYWETNGPQSAGQWFHGTVLAMGGSSGPFGSSSRKDVEVFYRAQ